MRREDLDSASCRAQILDWMARSRSQSGDASGTFVDSGVPAPEGEPWPGLVCTGLSSRGGVAAGVVALGGREEGGGGNGPRRGAHGVHLTPWPCPSVEGEGQTCGRESRGRRSRPRAVAPALHNMMIRRTRVTGIGPEPLEAADGLGQVFEIADPGPLDDRLDDAGDPAGGQERMNRRERGREKGGQNCQRMSQCQRRTDSRETACGKNPDVDVLKALAGAFP